MEYLIHQLIGLKEDKSISEESTEGKFYSRAAGAEVITDFSFFIRLCLSTKKIDHAIRFIMKEEDITAYLPAIQELVEEPRETTEEVREVDEGVEVLLGHPSILLAPPQPLFKLYLLALTRGLARTVTRMVETLKMPVNGIPQPNGTTAQAPLTIALASGQLEVAQKLVYLGANLNIVDPYGQTPLYLAAILPSVDVAFTKFMINRGALIKTQFPVNRHPLMGAVSVGNIGVVQYLLDEVGIEPKEVLFNDSSNLVHAAVRFNQMEALYALLTHRHGAYRYLVNMPDQEGNTALHVLLTTSHPVPTKISLAKALIQAGAELRLQNNNRNTPVELIPNDAEKEMILKELERDLTTDANQNCTIS